MFARRIARPVSVARLLVTHGYPLPTSSTRTIQSLHLTSSSSFATMTTQLLPSHSMLACPLVNHVNTQRISICRTYSDEITSSESEGTSSDEDEWTSLFDRVARASLSFVDKHGWSREAIQAGVKSLGLPGVAHGVMGNGGHDLLKYFEQQCNRELATYLETELQPLLFNEEPDKSTITLDQFIVTAIMKRLQLIQPFVHRWHEALTMKMDVTSNWSHFHNLSIIADDIWYYSKDQSIDCDWYVKRGHLALVYKRAEDHMIKDFSHELSDTQQHVEQMVQQMMTSLANIRLARLTIDMLGEVSWGYLSEVGSCVHKVTGVVDDGMTTVKNMMGINKIN